MRTALTRTRIRPHNRYSTICCLSGAIRLFRFRDFDTQLVHCWPSHAVDVVIVVAVNVLNLFGEPFDTAHAHTPHTHMAHILHIRLG